MRYTILLKCVVFCMLFLNTTCDDDVVEIPETECDQFAIADNSLYQGAQSDFYQIVSASSFLFTTTCVSHTNNYYYYRSGTQFLKKTVLKY